MRLSPRGIAGGASQSPDSSAELSRLVQRLQQSVLYADHDREKRLRSSEYERSRVGVVRLSGISSLYDCHTYTLNDC